MILCKIYVLKFVFSYTLFNAIIFYISHINNYKIITYIECTSSGLGDFIDSADLRTIVGKLTPKMSESTCSIAAMSAYTCITLEADMENEVIRSV